MSCVQPGDEAPACDLAFFPDDPDSGAALDLAVLLHPGCALTELSREGELLGTGPGPILLLDAATGCAIEQNYRRL